MQKFVVFLCTNNELSERKIKKAIPFTIALKIIKYLGINLTKKTKDPYLENYKALMKEIENNTNKWKNMLCSWFGRINIGKINMLPKAIYRFNAIPVKTPMSFVIEVNKYSIKNQHKRLRIAKKRKKNKAGGITCPDFRLLQSNSKQNSMVLA